MLRLPSAAFPRSLAILVFVSSVVVNVCLASRLSAARAAVFHGLTTNDVVSPFTATDRFGAPVQVDFGGPLPTVLYHFSPTCSWCERNWENVRALVQQTSGRYEVVGLSLTRPTDEFLQHRHLSFKVVVGLSVDTVQRLRLGGTPQTIVIAPGGHVLKSWAGVFGGSQAQSIEEFFRVAFPGLVAPHAGQ